MTVFISIPVRVLECNAEKINSFLILNSDN